MKNCSLLWISGVILLAVVMGSCSSSDDEDLREIDTIIPATPLQKAFYLTEDDTQQPLWLQEKIKETPYLKVYHSDKSGGRYLLEYPSRAQTKCELYNDDGQLQDVTTQDALNAVVAAGAPWICTHVYTYPLKAGTDEWRSLSVQERHERLQLSDNLLGSMRTEDLIEVCLEYPFAIDFFAFDDFQTGLMALYNEFNGFRELLSRDDLVEPFLLFLDVNWQKAELMKGRESLEIGMYTLLSVVFKYMLAQDAVINQMSRSQIRRMLDTCMRNNEIELSDTEMWSGVNHDATWYIYIKVIHNKGGFPYKDNREKRMVNAYVEHPNYYLFEEEGDVYLLLTDDFMERVMKYIESFN